MGDAFYRWDGFSYYASFTEFLPAVALAFIQWTVLSILLAISLWLLIKLLSFISFFGGGRIEVDHVLLFGVSFVALGGAVWKIKKVLWPLMQVSFTSKLIILFSVFVLSLFISLKFFNMFSRLMQLVQERITPLVWLFGILFFLSVPLVAYQTWFQKTESNVTKSTIQSSIADKGGPNIILVTFDAMTSRNMSVYGYHRETTPFITEWSKKATVFARAEAASTMTTSTIASLLTGKKLWSHQAYHIKSSVRKGKSQNIALEMKNRGYYTKMYSENSNGTPKVLGVSESFNDMTFTLEGRSFLYNYQAMLFAIYHGKILLYDWLLLDDFYPATLFLKYISPTYDKYFWKKWIKKGGIKKTLLDKFISDIDENQLAAPFFVWIHLYPPHGPYLPPQPFIGVFNPSPRFRTFYEQKEAEMRSREHEKVGYTKDDLEDMKILRDRYDENILYCDKMFEEFIENLKKRNILENSVIMLSSDHGESFEHGHWGHGKSPYEPVVHIPLIIREPDQKDGKVFDNLVEQIDITATIVDYAGASVPSWIEGRSLAPLMRGEDFPARPVFSMYFEGGRSRGHKITNGFINIYEGDYKLIYFIEENRSLLFNLREDPDEMNNLFESKPEIGKWLLALIKENLNEANEKITKGE